MKLSWNANVSPTREFPNYPAPALQSPRSGRHRFLRTDQTAACRTRRVRARVHRVGPLANRSLDRGTVRETNGASHTYAVSPSAWDVPYCREAGGGLRERTAGVSISAEPRSRALPPQAHRPEGAAMTRSPGPRSRHRPAWSARSRAQRPDRRRQSACRTGTGMAADRALRSVRPGLQHRGGLYVRESCAQCVPRHGA